MMNLDWIASALCGVIALCLFLLHVFSSPRRLPWVTLPEYVRCGLLLTGIMFTWRSVNFTTIANEPLSLGHINAEGMMALGCFAYTVGSLVFWMLLTVMPGKARIRAEWVKQQMARDPDLAPVLMPTQEVVATAKQKGLRAVGPMAPPSELTIPAPEVELP